MDDDEKDGGNNPTYPFHHQRYHTNSMSSTIDGEDEANLFPYDKLNGDSPPPSLTSTQPMHHQTASLDVSTLSNPPHPTGRTSPPVNIGNTVATGLSDEASSFFLQAYQQALSQQQCPPTSSSPSSSPTFGQRFSTSSSVQPLSAPSSVLSFPINPSPRENSQNGSNEQAMRRSDSSSFGQNHQAQHPAENLAQNSSSFGVQGIVSQNQAGASSFQPVPQSTKFQQQQQQYLTQLQQQQLNQVPSASSHPVFLSQPTIDQQQMLLQQRQSYLARQQQLIQQYQLYSAQENWRVSLKPADRSSVIAKLVISLRLAIGQEVPDDKVHHIACGMEQQLFERAPNRQIYVQMIDSQISSIQRSSNGQRQGPFQQYLAQLNGPGVSMSPGLPVPGANGTSSAGIVRNGLQAPLVAGPLGALQPSNISPAQFMYNQMLQRQLTQNSQGLQATNAPPINASRLGFPPTNLSVSMISPSSSAGGINNSDDFCFQPTESPLDSLPVPPTEATPSIATSNSASPNMMVGVTSDPNSGGRTGKEGASLLFGPTVSPAAPPPAGFQLTPQNLTHEEQAIVIEKMNALVPFYKKLDALMRTLYSIGGASESDKIRKLSAMKHMIKAQSDALPQNIFYFKPLAVHQLHRNILRFYAYAENLLRQAQFSSMSPQHLGGMQQGNPSNMGVMPTAPAVSPLMGQDLQQQQQLLQVHMMRQKQLYIQQQQQQVQGGGSVSGVSGPGVSNPPNPAMSWIPGSNSASPNPGAAPLARPLNSAQRAQLQQMNMQRQQFLQNQALYQNQQLQAQQEGIGSVGTAMPAASTSTVNVEPLDTIQPDQLAEVAGNVASELASDMSGQSHQQPQYRTMTQQPQVVGGRDGSPSALGNVFSSATTAPRQSASNFSQVTSAPIFASSQSEISPSAEDSLDLFFDLDYDSDNALLERNERKRTLKEDSDANDPKKRLTVSPPSEEETQPYSENERQPFVSDVRQPLILDTSLTLDRPESALEGVAVGGVGDIDRDPGQSNFQALRREIADLLAASKEQNLLTGFQLLDAITSDEADESSQYISVALDIANPACSLICELDILYYNFLADVSSASHEAGQCLLSIEVVAAEDGGDYQERLQRVQSRLTAVLGIGSRPSRHSVTAVYHSFLKQLSDAGNDNDSTR